MTIWTIWATCFLKVFFRVTLTRPSTRGKWLRLPADGCCRQHKEARNSMAPHLWTGLHHDVRCIYHGILLVNHSLLWWVNVPSCVAATAVVQHRHLEFGPKRWPWRGALSPTKLWLCGIDPLATHLLEKGIHVFSSWIYIAILLGQGHEMAGGHPPVKRRIHLPGGSSVCWFHLRFHQGQERVEKQTCISCNERACEQCWPHVGKVFFTLH